MKAPVAFLVVSRCLGIGPPSGIPPLGRCLCWPTNFVASLYRHLGNTPPSLYCLISQVRARLRVLPLIPREERERRAYQRYTKQNPSNLETLLLTKESTRCLSLTIGWAGVCCERRRSAHDGNGTFKEGPDTGGEGLVPRRTPRRGGGAHRDLTSDRAQTETG